ncbi:MAG: adenine deaminase C-terminal domain-containing protein, partial [Dehalococcoidia bacterium]
RLAAMKVALGEEEADLAIRNGQIIDVYSRQIYQGDIAIKGKLIAAVGEVAQCIGPATEILDADGYYLAPGFIDCHIHVGGSQLSMTQLARLLLSKGTIAIATDFYEIATIAGQEAARFCAEELGVTPLKLLFSPFFAAYLAVGPWGNPGRFSASDMMSSLDWPEITATREWQVGVTSIPDPAIRDFLSATYERRLVMEGHLEGRTGAVLQAAAAMGARSDHEMADAREALERIRLGIVVQARQGSAAWDLAKVVGALVENDVDSRAFMFSTDEMEADEIARDGHMDNKIRMAVEAGVDPLVAVQMATLNAAQFYRIDHELGSLTPGRNASVVFFEDLRGFRVARVVADGEVVAEGGQYTGDLSAPNYPKSAYEAMHVKAPLVAEDFRIAGPAVRSEVMINVIGIREGSLLTEHQVGELPVTEGEVRADPARDLAKIAVIDRHEASGRVGLGFIRGLGLNSGAVASSFNPGVCNIAVVGTNDVDMATVANRIVELGGGYVTAKDGKVLAEFPMPLWGIFSDCRMEEAVEQLKSVSQSLHRDLGTSFRGFHIGVGFCCLPIIIPSLKICDRGLVMVDRDFQEAIPLFVEE